VNSNKGKEEEMLTPIEERKRRCELLKMLKETDLN